jgi:hypothetical protein
MHHPIPMGNQVGENIEDLGLDRNGLARAPQFAPCSIKLAIAKDVAHRAPFTMIVHSLLPLGSHRNTLLFRAGFRCR